MGTPFEDFVNLELPRRSTFLNIGNTSYDGDPNDGGAPAIISGAPLGTWFREETAEKWWRKTESAWEEQGSGGGSGSISLIYEPSSSETGPTVFGGWTDLMARLNELRTAGGGDGNFAIGFSDKSLPSNGDPVIVPAGGPYDMSNVEWINASPSGATVHIADGASFTNLRRFKGILVQNLNTTNPADDSLGLGVTSTTVGIIEVEAGDLSSTPGGASFYGNTNLTAGKFVIVRARNGAIIAQNSEGPIVDMPASTFLIMSFEDAAARVERESALVGASGAILIEEYVGANKLLKSLSSWAGTRFTPRQHNPAALKVRPFLAAASTSSLTADFGEHLRLDASGGPIAQTLPDISSSETSNPGGFLTVAEVGGGQVTLNAAAGDTIRGSSSLTVPPNGGVILESDGISSWDVVGVFDPVTLFSNRLTYKPGVAGDTTVVFGTWTALMARLDQLRSGNGGGSYDVEVDDTLVSPAVIPIAAPTVGSPTAAFLFSTPTMSLTDGVASFTSAMIGRYITIAGATTPANNGTFRITGIPSATVAEYTNAAGVAEAQGATTYSITTPWDLTNTRLVGPIGSNSSCQLANGITFLGLRHIGSSLTVDALSVAPSPPLVTDFGANTFTTLVVEDGATVNAATGGVPVWDTTFGPSSFFLFVHIRNSGIVAQNPSGGQPVIHLGLAGQLMFMQASSQGGVWRNGVSSVVGTLMFASFDTSALWGIQQNFLGTVASEKVKIAGPGGNVNPTPLSAAHTSSVSLNIEDFWRRYDVSGGGFTQTLPAIAAIGGTKSTGRTMIFVEESGTKGLLLQGAGADTVNGAASTLAVPAGGMVVLINDGVSDWRVQSVFDPAARPSVDTALVSTTPNALSNGRVARYDTTVANIVSNLPAANSVLNGDVIYVSNEVGANAVNVTPAGADTVNSVAALFALTTGTSKQFRSDGVSNWTSF